MYSLKDIGITQSQIKNFINCPMKFSYFTQRLERVGKKGRSTGFGSIMHSTLENIYKNKGLTSKEVTETIESYCKKNISQLTGLVEELELVKLQVEVVAKEYQRIYSKDFKKWKVLFVEREGEISIDNILHRTKIDLGLEIMGKIYTLDHKTSSRIDETSLEKALAFDFQHLYYGYCYAQETGKKVAGCYHNVIRNPGLKYSGSFSDYSKRLQNEIRLKPEHYFKRYRIVYTNKDKKDFEYQLHYILSNISTTIKNNHFYRNSSHCNIYGECEFLDLCSSGSTTGYTVRDKYFAELESV